MKEFVTSKGDELVEYYSKCMSTPVEAPDEYKANKVRTGDLQLRINPSSNLPCCPIRNTFDAYKLLHATESDMTELQGTGMTYAGLGTLRHEICQDFLGRGGRIYGDWWCPKCNKIAHRACRYRACDCGTPCNYREMRFEHTYKGKVVKSFKLDGIYRDLDGKLWVLDYKFVSSYKLRSQLPSKNNLRQVLDYVHTLRVPEVGGKFRKVVGYILFYIGFENVYIERSGSRVVRGLVPKEDTGPYLKALELEYKRLLLARKVAGDPGDKWVEKLLKYRPCVNHDWYLENIHDSYNPCPWGDICHTKKMARQLGIDLNELEK